MSLNLSFINGQTCCTAAAIRIHDLQERERLFFADFMPQAVTAIVLAHHIITRAEWTWYADEYGEQFCQADDHLKQLCVTAQNELARLGHQAEIVKYPDTSGLQFRFVGQAAGLGTIGTNAFLFHPVWGPWIHLRVLATTAGLEMHPQPTGNQLCDQCGLCLAGCPAKAISDNSFAGLECQAFRAARGEYTPRGSRRLLPYCQRCICICPKGQPPASTSKNT